MTTPPDGNSYDDFLFHEGETRQPKKKPQPQEDDSESVVADVVEGVVDAVTDGNFLSGCGCLFQAITLPFRLIFRLVNALSD